MKNIIRHLAAAVSLFFYITVSYGSGCSKSNSSNCKTCTATNSYGNVIETKQVCTQQEEQDFKNHYNQATSTVTVTCN